MIEKEDGDEINMHHVCFGHWNSFPIEKTTKSMSCSWENDNWLFVYVQCVKSVFFPEFVEPRDDVYWRAHSFDHWGLLPVQSWFLT